MRKPERMPSLKRGREAGSRKFSSDGEKIIRDRFPLGTHDFHKQVIIQDMSLVTFQYNLRMDADNFIRGTRAVNSSEATPLQVEYESVFGKDFTSASVKNFLNERKKNLQINVDQIAKKGSGNGPLIFLVVAVVIFLILVIA